MARRRPKLGTHTREQFKAFYWGVVCPKCNAPIGAPCADFRSYDLNLKDVPYIHKEREDLVLER